MMSKRAGKPKTSRSLTATLVIAFLGLTLAALLVANLSVFVFLGRAIQESVDSRQQLAAKEAANTVASFVQEKFSEMETAVKIGESTLTLQEEQRNALGNLMGLVPAFRQLILFDAQDQAVIQVSRISQTAAAELQARLDPDFFAQVRQANRYVSPAYIAEQTSEPMIIMAVPARDALGDFQGTLLAEVNLKFMWDLVDRLQVGQTGRAYVVDKQGNLLAFDDISRVLRGENVGQLEMVSEFMRNPVLAGEAETRMVKGINGTTVVGTYVPLGLPDWAVAVELPLAEAFQPGIQTTLILGALMLAIAALVGWVAVYIARRLAGPLLNLTTTAGRIASGEIDLRAAQEGPAEVVNLARAFNIMTAQQSELINSLEQRVADRTRALEQQTVQLTTAADVGRAAASILDSEMLAREVVELVQERFDLYYAGLFLLDDTGKYAVLEAGTGEAGQTMKEQGHNLEVGGTSMVGAACEMRQTIVAQDVSEQPRRFDNPLLPETRSEMALPLLLGGGRQDTSRSAYGDRVLGALDVQSIRHDAFSEEEITVFQLVADQVAVAVDNALKFSDAAEILESSSPMFRISRRLAEATTPEEVGQAVVMSVAETSAEGGAMARLERAMDGEVEAITFLASWNRRRSPRFPPRLSLPPSPAFPLSLATKRTIVENIEEDDGLPEEARQYLLALGVQALALLPLRLGGRGEGVSHAAYGDRVLGFIVVDRGTPGPFSEAALNFYEALSEQAAAALDRARLLEESQQQAWREHVIRDISDRVTTSFDLDTLLHETLQEVGRVVGAAGGYVELGGSGERD
jgi:GAF domain-containing protein/HAMP domain-containing protein